MLYSLMKGAGVYDQVIEKDGHRMFLEDAVKDLNCAKHKELKNDLLVMSNARRLIKAPKSTSNARLCAELFGTDHGTARDYCRKLGLDPDSNLTPFK